VLPDGGYQEVWRHRRGLDSHYNNLVCADGLVFGYFETEESLSAAQARMASREINTRWQQFMSAYVDANARPDETFVELEEYFHLE
jgi:L-rhamnose mutarotase